MPKNWEIDQNDLAQATFYNLIYSGDKFKFSKNLGYVKYIYERSHWS
jgi:hypothetical protein